MSQVTWSARFVLFICIQQHTRATRVSSEQMNWTSPYWTRDDPWVELYSSNAGESFDTRYSGARRTRASNILPTPCAIWHAHPFVVCTRNALKFGVKMAISSQMHTQPVRNDRLTRRTAERGGVAGQGCPVGVAGQKSNSKIGTGN